MNSVNTRMIIQVCITMAVITVSACGGGGGGGSPPPPAVAFCETKTFTSPAQSPYVLPYPPGATYTMFQGNCSPPPGGHQTTFAYDFDHAMGDPIAATRAGRVTNTANNFPDDGDAANAGGNSVWVLHDDGTIAAYFHMCEGCVMVVVDQQVTQGEILGLAGNSGASSGPHLHFQVFEDNTSFNNDDAIPITFSNVTGSMAPTGELIEGQAYTAN